jgi:hypothetical protein
MTKAEEQQKRAMDAKRTAQADAIRRTMTPSSTDDITQAEVLLRRLRAGQMFASGSNLEDIAMSCNVTEVTTIDDIRHEFLRMWLQDRTKARGRQARGRKR